MNFLRLYLQSSRAQKALKLKPGEEGFSLVELVVVIAVLAILSAVAIPAFQGVQNRAKMSAVKNGITNGVKECIVQDGLGEGITWYETNSTTIRAKAYAGDYSGYTIGMRRGIEDTCYKVQANATEDSLPYFILEYDPATGVSTKLCESGKTGCDDGTW